MIFPDDPHPACGHLLPAPASEGFSPLNIAQRTAKIVDEIKIKRNESAF
jgi:hypothetical protein